MKKIILITTAAFVLTAPAVAQQAPDSQALAAKLMEEINGGLQCRTALITGQQEQTKMQAEIKRLKEKYEPETKTEPAK